MALHVEHRRTCLAFSPGGHHAELMRALDGIRFTDCFHVTFASQRPDDPLARRTYRLCHPRRVPGRTLVNVLQTLFSTRRSSDLDRKSVV